ncbi:MAG TPA: TM2 domain-containing protein [Candidatus Cybelea sp.]|nr:TM2 domain-containing protein [Candidatus Cybelea sp.]
MDQKTKEQITAELTAEYRAAIKRTADEEEANKRRRPVGGGPKSMGVAYLLWFFFGTLGGHRLYLGRISSGAAMAALAITGSVMTFASLTGVLHVGPIGILFSGPAFVWWLVDAFLIPGMVPD